jgi:DNA-binding Lrp family transcriptional regulator
MPKSSLTQMEKDEKKILNELSKNATKSINEIAKSLGFSRQKVWRVIKKLEKNNTIWGYIPVLNQEKLDVENYTLLAKRTNIPSKDEVINKIVNRELVNEVSLIGVQVTNSFFTQGTYDWIICFNAPNIKVAKNFVEKFNQKYEGYVKETHLHQNIFPLVSSGITNPEIEKLKKFLKI